MDVLARLRGRPPVPRRAGIHSSASPVETPARAEGLVVIRCVGREFLTRISMATIFLRRSGEVIASDGSELVPLLHEGGIELLAVTKSMPITVAEVPEG
ncbi:hypothetical protein [Lacisediminihabitans sp.]|uniref:hypothetical protein n=1 Tax=Lacisediminihabitans sp. TaxID=2787631 RepID=UPI002F9213FE